MHLYRTHNCGQLSENHAGEQARLSGWLFRKRDHGSLLFIDLRDHHGLTQVVAHPDRDFFERLSRLRLESVVTFTGRVALRDPDTVNPDLATGKVELVAESLQVQSESDATPLYLAGDEEGPEDLRLRYRYLDLRRDRLHRNIVLRSRVINHLRRLMQEHGFLEFQTPILTSSSPEGARDYLVPSRLHPGRFYALPQAPQIFKQLLMVSGFDRYFQIAPCFRDEDARADRSPGEFYQLDLEMAFASQDDVFAVVEKVMSDTFSTFNDLPVDEPPFVRIPYAEAMLKYGTDKPDLRNPIEIRDVTGVFRGSDFKAFAGAVARGAVVRAIPVKGIKDRPRSFFDRMVDFARSVGAGGLAYLVWDGERIKGPIAKFLDGAAMASLAPDAEDGDGMFFVCDQPADAARIAGEVRTRLAETLDLTGNGSFRFCWVVDFPMFERDPESGEIVFSHNPFSMPQGGLEALEQQSPLEIKAFQYDLVCNGVELSSGAIRNHCPEIMARAFALAGYPEGEVARRFPSLWNALHYGAPPHGGIAPGIDRILMLLAGERNIREVIAFPMNQRAQDLMMDAPSEVNERQLRELHIDIRRK